MDKGKQKIVLLEDEKLLSEAVKDKLTREGYHVLIAFNGKEGIKIIKENKPDLILLDLIMPFKDGKEVLKELKNIPDLKEIPVIILSNLGQDSGIEQAKDLGAVDYLIKSNLKIKELVNKIKKYLN